MKYFKKRIFIIILVQIVVIVDLIIIIFEKESNRVKISNLDLNTKNESISSSESSLQYFYEPTRNFIDTNNGQVKGVDIDLKIIFNEDTLNESINYSLNKPDDVFRIIILGDSSTSGVFVSTSKNYSEQLENLLNSEKICSKYSKIEVINLGVPGYDQEYAVERYISRGKKYNPDLVIWHLVSIEKHNETLIPYLKNNPTATPSDIEEFVKEVDKSTMLERQKKPILRFLYHFNKKTILLTESYEAAKINSEFNAFLSDLIATNPNIQTLKNIFVLGNTNENVTFEKDGHPNNKGHFLISKHLFNHLKNNKIICTE